MSIDHIRLPAFLVQNMFGKNLIDVKENVPHDVAEEVILNFLGGNEKKIVFLFNDNRTRFLGDIQMRFLYDLLAACGLTVADIALVNFCHNKNITYRELLVQLQPARILIFGIPAAELDLPFAIPFFQVQNFQQQVYMIGPPIDELLVNAELKKQLWACLQKIFNLRKQK
jgi:hypothetical protein